LTVREAIESSWDAAQIVAQSITTGERTVLIEGGHDGRYLSTGHLVYALNNALFAVPFDVGSRQVTGKPGAARRRGQVGTESWAAQFSLSASGTLVYVSGATVAAKAQLVWVDRMGDVEALPDEMAQYRTLRVSPDGRRLAVGTATDDVENI